MKELIQKTMNFHCAGFVSEELLNVIYEDTTILVLSEINQYLSLEDYLALDKSGHVFPSGDSYWIFEKRLGSCLNDLRLHGCRRSLKYEK